MKAFLYHVLNNLIIDEYRKRKTSSLDDLCEKGFEPGVDESEKLYESLDGKAAMLMIEKLPAKYQKAMRMRYAQGLSIAEISEKTGQSKGAVAVQTHRGLGLLRVLCHCKPVAVALSPIALALAEKVHLARQAWVELYRKLPLGK